MAVELGTSVLHHFRRFSLYNSPFEAHDDGSAIDLYPPAESSHVPSPVAGEVRDVKTVTAPPKPYAATTDQLLLVDTGEYVARLLHVDAAVDPGDTVSVGEPLGRPIRAGFFAPWVPTHVHLEFRSQTVDPYRASGSVSLAIDAPIQGRSWDGTGTVVAVGDTWARLDEPGHPAPGTRFVGLASEGGGILDGGLPHFDGGGLLGDRATPRLLGTRLGTTDGRTIDWGNLSVQVNGDSITGIACYCARRRFGVTLIGRELDLERGDDVTVSISRN